VPKQLIITENLKTKTTVSYYIYQQLSDSVVQLVAHSVTYNKQHMFNQQRESVATIQATVLSGGSMFVSQNFGPVC